VDEDEDSSEDGGGTPLGRQASTRLATKKASNQNNPNPTQPN